jgi:hypothetical protein
MIEDPFLALTVGGIAALAITLVVAVSLVLWISAKRSLPAAAEARRGWDEPARSKFLSYDPRHLASSDLDSMVRRFGRRAAIHDVGAVRPSQACAKKRPQRWSAEAV